MPPECTLDHSLALISSRRSIAPKRLRPPGPTIAEIEAMVGAALTAPDHGGLRPWRLIRVTDDGRERLADVFVAAKRQRLPDTSEAILERERDKALNGPVMLVVCARPRTDRADVPPHEQLIAVGAAVQNIMLAAHALGYGASLLSGAKAGDPLVRAALGLLPDEILVGFLTIGSIARPAPMRPCQDVHPLITVWSGPARASAPRKAVDAIDVPFERSGDTQLALPL